MPVAHVKFLEAAGARVFPINYRMKKENLIEVLRSINGAYIAGDLMDIIYNDKYMECV